MGHRLDGSTLRVARQTYVRKMLDLEQMFEDTRAMSRTHVRRRRTLAFLAVIAIVVPTTRAAAAGTGARGDERVEAYVVRSGDTLWGIAEEHDLSGDPRSGVQMILRLNPGVTTLQPGMSLRLPTA